MTELAQTALGSRIAVRVAGGLLLAQAALASGVWWLTRCHWLVAIVVAGSAVAFLTYGYDKRAAGVGGTRIPERVLHLLALLGGAPGAWLGQQAFRHKTQKRSFQIAFWVICGVQVGLLIAVLASSLSARA